MAPDTDPSAAIRDRAGIVAKLGPPRPGGDLINAAHRSAADVPRLLAAVEAALDLADNWAARCGPLIAGHGGQLRETIRAALAGEGAGRG